MANLGQGSIHTSNNKQGAPFPAGSAENGTSIENGKVVLGDGNTGAANLISDRFIESAGNNVRFSQNGNQLLETLPLTMEVAVSIPNTEDAPLVVHGANNVLKSSLQNFLFVSGSATTNNATPVTIYTNTVGFAVLENHNFHLQIQCIVQGAATSKSFIVQCSNNANGGTGAGIAIISGIGDAILAAATVVVNIVADVMQIQVQGIAATSIEWTLFGFKAIVLTNAP